MFVGTLFFLVATLSVPARTRDGRGGVLLAPGPSGGGHRVPQTQAIHIPKTGMSVLIDEMMQKEGMGPQCFNNTVATDCEICAAAAEDAAPGAVTVTIFRAPREHVISQYLECR